jgi:acyl dehydratase
MNTAQQALVEKLLGKVYSTFNFTLTPDQAILYHLATGSLTDTSLTSLKYLYEGELSVFPTFVAATCASDIHAFFEIPELKELCSGLEIPEILLHGEEDLEMFGPLRVGAEYRVTSTIVDVVDKGKMTIIAIHKDLIDSEEVKCARVTTRVVLRGIGGFGNQRVLVAPLALPKAPERDPDEVIPEISLLPNQNAIYRLTGDKNLIHIDLEVAKRAGFPQPILHGLCTYAVSARAAFGRLCERGHLAHDVDLIERVGARFTSHVFPGETLALKLWRLEEN